MNYQKNLQETLKKISEEVLLEVPIGIIVRSGRILTGICGGIIIWISRGAVGEISGEFSEGMAFLKISGEIYEDTSGEDSSNKFLEVS